MSGMNEIEVNGESRRMPVGASVDDLVRSLGRDPRTVAVEHNGEILPRARYATTDPTAPRVPISSGRMTSLALTFFFA